MYAYGYEEYYDDQSERGDQSTLAESVYSQSTYDQSTAYSRSAYSRSQVASVYDQSEYTQEQSVYDQSEYSQSLRSGYNDESVYDQSEYGQSSYGRSEYDQEESLIDRSESTYGESSADEDVSASYDDYEEYYDDEEEDEEEEEEEEEYCDEEPYFPPIPPLQSFQFESENNAIREVNISKLAFSRLAEEDLPESYKDATMYGSWLNLLKRGEEKVKEEPPKKRRKKRPIKMLDNDSKKYEYSYPFTKKRKYYTMTTVVAAISLAVTGIYLSSEALSTVSPQDYRGSHIDKGAEFFYLPSFQFGGLTGGLKGAVQRRTDVVEASMGDGSVYGLEAMDALPRMVPLLQKSRSKNAAFPSTQDPFHGFGPPQFHPGHSTRSISLDGSDPDKTTISSASLSSYNPPSQEGDPAIVLDPMFHGSMMDVSQLPYNRVREIPVFWDIPMTGGSMLQHMLGKCLKLVQCSEVGSELLERDHQDMVDTTLEAVPLKASFIRSSAFANVDCSTSSGIDRGISQNLATSKIVDVIYSPDVMDVARLFLPPIEAYGRGMVIFRHPMNRVIALYENMKNAKHDPISNVVGRLSLEEFARSDFTEDNPLTRSLSGNKDAQIKNSDFLVAKEILKRKFIVGLYNQMGESIDRFDKFFGWQVSKNAHTCQNGELYRESTAPYNRYSNKEHFGLTPAAFELIEAKNGFDIMLYDYAKFLFDYQGHALFAAEDEAPRSR